MIEYISFDLDGTLMNSKGVVNDDCIKVIELIKRKGVKIIFNTARPLQLIPQDLYNHFFEDFWVLSNGTTVISSGVILRDVTINNQDINTFLRWLPNEIKNEFFSFEINGKIYSHYHCETTCNNYFAEKVEVEWILQNHANKILFIPNCGNSFNFHLIDKIDKLHSNIRLVVTDNYKYFQFMPSSESKLSAINYIIEKENKKLNNVMAFGNDMNDFELLEKCGYPVAPINAIDEIKMISKNIVGHNNERGITKFVENYFNISI